MPDNQSQSEPGYAWVILFIATILSGMAFGAIVNIAVFLKPLAADFGWQRADLSFAYTVASLSVGAGGVLMGHFSDKMPVKRVVLFGALMPGLGFFLLSTMQTLPELYIYHFIIGFFGFGAIMVPMNNLLTHWFSGRMGLAIGISSAGGALGQGLIPFLSRNLILWQGWRDAYFTMGIIYIAVLVTLALMVRQPPGSGVTLSANVQEKNPFGLSRKKLVGILCLAVFFCCVTMATPIVHVASLGSDSGLGPREAAGLLTTMMVFGMFGRVFIGWVVDRLGALNAYIITSIAQTFLAMWFPYFSGVSELYILSALFGFGYSGVMTSLIICSRQYAPPGRTGISMGLVSLLGWAGMGVGSWQGGLFFDIYQTYHQAFLNSTLSGLINLALLAVLYHYTIRLPKNLALQPAI